MQAIDVEIEGITTLLVNRFHEDAREEATTGIHARKEYPPHELDALSRLYLFSGEDGKADDGRPYVPAVWVWRSLLDEAPRWKQGRTAVTRDVAGTLYITPDAIPLRPAGPTRQPGGWEVNAQAVVIPATKGRVMRYRPEFAIGWRLGFRITYDPAQLKPDVVRGLVDGAGSRVGIGDFRPARKGPHGRFRVARWDEAR